MQEKRVKEISLNKKRNDNKIRQSVYIIASILLLTGCSQEIYEHTNEQISDRQKEEAGEQPNHETSEPTDTERAQQTTQGINANQMTAQKEPDTVNAPEIPQVPKDARDMYAALPDDDFREIVIQEGVVYKDDIVYEREGRGLLSTGDAALDAELLGEIVLNMLESADVQTYGELFSSDTSFRKFQEQDWDGLDAGWTADRYYDCYYTYITEAEGYIGYTYYIYPDYETMKIQDAKAVELGFHMTVEEGKICDTELQLYDMTREEYQAFRKWQGGRIAVMEEGEIVGGGSILIPGQDRLYLDAGYIVHGWEIQIAEDDERYHYSTGDGIKRLADVLMSDFRQGTIENGETSGYIMENGDVGLTELADGIRENTGDGWQLRDGYDLYYLILDDKPGRIHYRYYFYWHKPGEAYEKVLMTDAWVSEMGIEELQSHWFCTCRHREDVGPVPAYEASAIEAYMTVDWSDEEILMMGHTIWPGDSAQGWEFTIADMDFDGEQEFLVNFIANHCGSNALYIYKQEDGEVFSYADMIAVPQRYILGPQEYKEILPCMDIEFMDAYVNSAQEYRYLTMDWTSFGGDIHGGIETCILYETLLPEGEPREIARIEYCGPEESRELYFLGEKVYEAGRLRDMIDSYMAGYTKVEMPYRTVQKTFPRGIVGYSEKEREQENRELWESIRDCCKE